MELLFLVLALIAAAAPVWVACWAFWPIAERANRWLSLGVTAAVVAASFVVGLAIGFAMTAIAGLIFGMDQIGPSGLSLGLTFYPAFTTPFLTILMFAPGMIWRMLRPAPPRG